MDVEAGDLAAYGFRDVQGVAPRAAPNFQDSRVRRKTQPNRNLLGLFAVDPACLPQVFAVGLKPDFAIDVQAIVAVGVIVEIDWGGHGFADSLAIK
jgi:hypothetical protein